MASPYSDNGEWLTEHIRSEGFTPYEVATAAVMDIAVIVNDDDLNAYERLQLIREVTELVGGHNAPTG